MRLLRIVLLLLAFQMHAQQGGMWIPSLLEGMNEKEMKSLGMKMSAKDIYDINQSSLKDAVPHFDGGCTAEVISPKGLLLTNHHCGYGEIQQHSTVENDYLQHGFWARSLAEELPNPGMTVTFIIRIDDVTSQVLAGTTEQMAYADKMKKVEANIADLNKNYPRESWQDVRVRSFFDGNQYLLFIVENFKDIRLVGAPPSSIGKFGSDTDNWVWPRHTGDFSLFRVYADANNRPAEYSATNVPYTPKHYFPISIGGVEEDDFTMVFGYPGRTTEYLPAVAIEQIVNDLNPVKIGIRDAALKVQDGFMRKDQAIKIQYASKYASTANYWKKWIGESQGLKKSNAVAVKRQYEKEFTERVSKTGKSAEYGNLLPQFEQLYREITPYSVARDYFQETIRNVEGLLIGYQLNQLVGVYEARGAQAFLDRKAAMIERISSLYKDMHHEVDQRVFEQLIQLYANSTSNGFVPQRLQGVDASALAQTTYANTSLTSKEKFEALMAGDNAEAIVNRLKQDPLYQIATEIATTYMEQVAPKYTELNEKITDLQRVYMKGQLEMFKDKRIFPDANSTLRVTYGKVKGYAPRDAVYYEPLTYLDGVMEKYVPGDYEFDLPQRLIDLYNAKDFGPYAVNGRLPVNFIGTNHTTGGNSGSPAIDAHGNLIGLNFDRVWEGTMSDVYYDPAICRNIMVDMRYVLFVIDKYAGAQNIINELKIVNPKAKKNKKKK